MCNYQDRENLDNECRSDRGVGRSFRGLSRDRKFSTVCKTRYTTFVSCLMGRDCVRMHTYVYTLEDVLRM